MTHALHFFVLSDSAVSTLPDEARAARAFIRAQGEKVGSIEFPPGLSTLFFVAAEELTGAELMGLLSGPVGEAEPTDDEIFGGLDRAAAEEAFGAINRFLDETPETSAGLVEVASTYSLSAEQLMLWMNELKGILARALDQKGEVATVYR